VSGLKNCSGLWAAQDASSHINLLEMKAVWLTLQCLEGRVQGQSVLILTDNTTVAAYLTRDGGMHSRTLNALARETISWCLARAIRIAGAHVPGVDNVLADALSRQWQTASRDTFRSAEWSLDQKLANQIFLRWGRPSIDIIATAQNPKLSSFCSLTPHPEAELIPAMVRPWNKDLVYAYSPMALTLRCIHKVMRQEADAILIRPWWPRRGWFHTNEHASRTTHNASANRAVAHRPTGRTAPRPRDPPANRRAGLGRSLKASGVSDAVAATLRQPTGLRRAFIPDKVEVFSGVG